MSWCSIILAELRDTNPYLQLLKYDIGHPQSNLRVKVHYHSAMEQETALYLESHERLLNWTHELEFLGYILSEIVDPHGLDKQGFTCHQAVNLPTIIYITSTCMLPAWW